MSDEFKIIRDALKVLELPVLVAFADIKKQYYKLSKKHHPDLNKEDSNMADINDAYAVLKKYVFNYRFSFSDEEMSKQFPESTHATKFRF